MKCFDARQLTGLARQYGSPLWVYHADTIRQRIAELKRFDVIRYAQKANSNIHILGLMREQGVKVDAVSLGEIERALAAGYQADSAEPSDIVFTADVLDRATLERVAAAGIAVNAGSIDMLRQLGAASPGHRVWLRVNPGFGHGHSQKTNTGGENSKHGIWHEQVSDALAVIRQFGLRLVGLHMHIGSGVDYGHLQQVCGAMVKLATELGHDIEAISAGGGLSIPYRDGDARIDTAHYFELWDEARRRIAAHLGHPVRLEIEPGRFLVAESGALISEVRAVKTMGSRRFVLVDAGFNDLMRPAMYGSHHDITVLSADGAEKSGERAPCVVAGPLCESGDVFTQQEGGVVESRPLPDAQVGDLLVFHDAGAYGATMSSNYNSRPLLAEALIDGASSRLIRRRQTMAELLELERV
ncbi:diaminopimelate decarboxylase [Chromobacterium alkanivorans]|uniref:diaminopimelate decarboxylase n=1 Tax=Chromobacterium alkanivorans TaxID=1071719 RepID=UPI0019670FCD|nr:diaminopimelate decarboxylase [Chromobacterium alkanivorans]MBN3002739.1 diaminopimelate decarboxylase [Chromobacterium alkanivorans]